MEPTRKTRKYSSAKRAAAARRTQQAILAAARSEFLAHGYAGTTVASIARAAEVAVDTVYASIGTKPQLFRLLLETAISGAEGPVPALERDYVRRIEASDDAEEKLAIYAAAVTTIHARLAPLFLVLQQAGPGEPSLAELWANISNRRWRNMQLFAESLSRTGRLRPDLSLIQAADIIWSMNSPEYYLLLVDQRRWTPEQYRDWLCEAWQRLLLTKS
jgi:AcrR family transcriptional regulator